jgi:hypothetical protein
MHAKPWGTELNSWRSQGTAAKSKTWAESSEKLTTPRSISTPATMDRYAVSYDPYLSTHVFTKETSHAIIDSGASCCVTPYIEDFIHQTTPIQNTTLKGIAGGLTALGRGTVQIKIHQ